MISVEVSDTFPELTDREREELVLIARDKIMLKLPMSWSSAPKPSATTSPAFLGELQVPDRVQAIVKAREAGLGSAPE